MIKSILVGIHSFPLRVRFLQRGQETKLVRIPLFINTKLRVIEKGNSELTVLYGDYIIIGVGQSTWCIVGICVSTGLFHVRERVHEGFSGTAKKFDVIIGMTSVIER